MMDAYPNDLFSVEYDETKIATKTIKWTLGATGTTKHEIVSPILTKFELGNIVAHCLTVMRKINACIGNHPADRFALYMDVFLRTLLLPHVATWDAVLIDHPLATQDEAGFQQAIRHFIAVHATGTLSKMSSSTTNLVMHVNSKNVTRLNHGMPFGHSEISEVMCHSHEL
jgi:hypothetical protein